MPKSYETLVELFDLSTAEFAGNEFLGSKHPDGNWTWMSYRDFRKAVEDARAGLHALGVRSGDRVAVVSDNRPEWAVLCFATFSLGACFVPMYEEQQPDEWAFILEDCRAKVAFGSLRSVFERLAAETSKLPFVEHVLGFELEPSDTASYAQLIAAGHKNPVPAAQVAPDDIASFIYTSGTTGNPKGVKLSHKNFSTNVLGSSSRFNFGPGDRSLAFLPWAHSFGQVAELYTFLHFGAAIAINDSKANLINNLAVVRPTILVAVPRIFNRIYDGVNKQIAQKPAPIQKLFRAGIRAATKKNRGESIGFSEKLALKAADKLIFGKVRLRFGGRLRFVVSGSAALSTEVAEFIDALGIDVYEGYGLTETSPVVSVNYPGHRKIGTVGPPIPGVTVRIDHEAAGDEINGEIIISGPNVMQGYHDRDEENAAVLQADGSLRSGDMGYLDADGFLVLTGRIKEQYKLENGKYVVPSPLEEELKLSPHILNVMLHGANRLHNVALVVIDEASVRSWAEDEGITLGDATQNPEVKKLIRAELERYSATFKGYERPRDFVLALEDFSSENGMLTPSLKVKRRYVLARYGDALEALYSKG